jgi:OOP family OmpA-OmpF porin
MILSTDRANSVKTYLVNAGVNAANITVKGFGTSNPIADNSTEEGRILNRRVEVKKLK